MKILFINAVFLLCFIPSYCFSAPVIRVLIFRDIPSITVSAKNILSGRTPDKKEPWRKFSNNTTVKAGLRNLAVSGSTNNINRFRFKSSSGVVNVNGILLRGEVDVYYTSYKKLTVINAIDIEDYLKGVIPNEISYSWPVGMIAAQAIVARTYAYIAVKKNLNQLFDVEKNTLSQVYRGFLSEKSKINDVLDRTNGKILTYNNTPVKVFYHSHCGGWTEKSYDVWEGSAKNSYEENIKDDYCSGIKDYHWEFSAGRDELKTALMKINPVFRSAPEDIQIDSISPTGRVKSVGILLKGKWHKFNTNDLRLALGAGNLKSTLFTIIPENKKWRFTGRGYGHGIGLCQWGGRAMAQEGYSASEILDFYFPSTRVKKVW